MYSEGGNYVLLFPGLISLGLPLFQRIPHQAALARCRLKVSNQEQTSARLSKNLVPVVVSILKREGYIMEYGTSRWRSRFLTSRNRAHLLKLSGEIRVDRNLGVIQLYLPFSACYG